MKNSKSRKANFKKLDSNQLTKIYGGRPDPDPTIWNILLDTAGHVAKGGANP